MMKILLYDVVRCAVIAPPFSFIIGYHVALAEFN
jgi:hypothetical protein